ncbi:MAG: hypothetical protein CO042_00270 [Parcubacteria group bacterium CG_4_9_14_0_2_um_filter_41_8]|nr:MAG: hypothetical protein AUJ34_01750 [Parcubacteria group bacterium CG1_02_41_12]PIP67337.1 MAG: hypothetical protein COW93_00675 [Parcubacteria group bacterium CG22_combo_CG10-13_8_21_14_all_41_9]PIQ80066.1 MAG: hypothetical protein COV79_02435 [Parcubacteria group bacterium CG11_big_fil_rev_8_21_14_0_20_41_14]PIR56984.1 MAG: hypothetical protein COU72_03330 [Parcubacteria group bacterium CG10_big_fil_rev_8_21_14_0_10_41_35]PJC41089.1 MAG: hypothetical protein CO042_00270 [Parcubacteria gr
MKTLLLCSSGQFITNHDLPFLKKPIHEMKMAYITTASKGISKPSKEKLEKRMQMALQGFNLEELDIEGKTEQELREILKDKEAIYVEGGSAFYLLKAVRESGFDNVVKDLISKGVLYIGSSAGSYICCPSIEMALWKHQDKYEHCGLTNFTGLNLVSFLITVHYKQEYEALLKEKISQAKYQVKILTDDQAILVQDDKVELIGEGREIQL